MNKNQGNNQGVALVMVIMVVLVLLTIGTVLVMRASFEIRHANQDRANQQVYYAARSASNYGVAYTMARIDSIPDTGDTLTFNLPADFFDTDYDFLQDTGWDEFGIMAVVEPTDTVSLDSRSQFAGLSAFVRPISVEGRARGPLSERSLVSHEFQVQQLPVFEFAGLTNDDLNYSTPLGMGGRFHSNEDIFLDVNTSYGTSGIGIGNGSEQIFLNPINSETVMTAFGSFSRGASGSVYFQRVDGDIEQPLTSNQDWELITSNTDLSDYDRLIQEGEDGIKAVNMPLPEGVDLYELVDEGESSDDAALLSNRLYHQSTMRIETVARDILAATPTGYKGWQPDTTKVWIPIRPEYLANADTSIFYQLLHDEDLQEEYARPNKEQIDLEILSSVWRSPNTINNEWANAAFETTNGSDGRVKLTLCHIAPGNRGNAHEIRVGFAAARAHIGHGCYLGPCCDLCVGSGQDAQITDIRGNTLGGQWSGQAP